MLVQQGVKSWDVAQQYLHITAMVDDWGNMEVSEVFWDFPTIELLGYPHDLGNLHSGIEWDLV